MPGPRPAAFSVGSSEPITTRAIPASRIASVQGGWRPWWAQGSRVTYIVAPEGSSPRDRQSSSAARSACSSPRTAWKPSPIDLSVADENRTDQRVRADPPAPPLGELEGPLEMGAIRGCRAGLHSLTDWSVNQWYLARSAPTAASGDTLTGQR